MRIRLTTGELQSTSCRKILMLSTLVPQPEQLSKLSSVQEIINWTASTFLCKTLNPLSKLFYTCRHVLKIFSNVDILSGAGALSLKRHYTVNSLAVAVSAIKEWIQTVIQKDSAVGWHELNELLGLPQ